MTTPVSLLPVAGSVATAGGAAAAPDDVFASVLAALSGALGLPVPTVAQPVPEQTAAAPGPVVAPTAALPTPAVPTAADVAAVLHAPEITPAAWTAVTQRPPLTAEPQPVEVAPVDPTPVPVETKAPEHLPEVHHATDVPDAVPVPTQPEPAVPVVQVAAAPAPAHAADPSPVAPTTSTHHVKPALLEAARGLRHEGGGRTSLVVRLDPPELGAVLVKLTVQDGRVDVTLRTPDLAARADLQAQSFEVEQVLRDQGFDLSSFDVAHGDVLSGGQQDASDRSTPERSRRADGHTADNPVTDDGPAPEPSGTWL